ncbi:PqiB family protein [Yoonia sediminilitoris]|uniref:Paraquat-inducible protein B n=1 Tax=Yoonia sediminilitoris TaxID=1286148 RepID=A0A2T6KR26_9RHOB|nr:MlaD family protein [Yoonia sediminilitoris]PUB19018.1 paraquat-inducible protein B [Yoonia sediminilitoris]RCW99186.1 paraquat-inducible protein B [Yoonia sediminilitoris]
MQDNATKGPAPLDVRPVKRPLWRRLSLVWLVPILALSVSLYAAWQNYLDQGTLITISFENGSGIKAGETKIKYRDVTVGDVEKVEFAEGLSVVLVHARVDKSVAPYLDDDAEFWVVRPDVSVRGISGLDTVLSGVYIEGNWDTQADVAQYEFTGLEAPSLTRAGQRGTSIILRASDGNAVSAGAPILHKGIQVGFLEKPELSADGTEVLVNAFVESPYDRRITTSTRFWDTSGFSVSFGASGVSLNVNSLASIIEGGVAFDTIVSGGRPIQSGHRFDLFDGPQAARDSLFTDPNAEALEVAVLFEEAVTGLSPGAEVRFQGIQVGEVTDINAIVVGEGETAEVRLQAVLSIEPSRLGMSSDATPAAALALLSDFVNRGLRARMITGNILSGSVLVELVQIDDALPAIVTLTTGEYPVIPTTESEISDVAASAEGVLARINALPVEELMDGAIELMGSIERLANDEYTRAVPASVVALMDEARTLVASEDLQAIPNDIRQAVSNLDAILLDVDETQVVPNLNAAIANTNVAVTNIASATERLPDLIGQIETLTAKANALELDALVASATSTLSTIDSFVENEDTAALPASLNGALDEMRGFLTEVREGGAIENVNQALASANQAAQAIEESVSTLPALSARASQLVAETQTVINSYGERSRFTAETLSTLRDIQEAADAVSSLARTIQRNPNSLLTGR